MVAGPDGPANRDRIHHTPGPPWFAQDRRIRRVQRTSAGTAPDGRTYYAADPHLLEWVHVAEVRSAMTANTGGR